MIYRGYTIKRKVYQDCNNYQIITPKGNVWEEIAVNLKTAKRWIDYQLSPYWKG